MSHFASFLSFLTIYLAKYICSFLL
jgi:hypothetical protein